MNNYPLVCIGITAYSRPDGLEKCLKSILNQTYKNFKITISIDKSENQTNLYDKIKYLINDKINVVLQKTNLGMFGNYEYIFNSISGDYFFCCDDDDFYEPEFIQTGITILETNKIYDLWFPTMNNTNAFGKVFQEYPSSERLTSTDNFEFDIIRFINEPEIRGKCNFMYGIFRSESVKNIIKYYFLNDSWGSDNSFMLAFISRYKLIGTSEVLFHKGNYSITTNTCGSAKSRSLSMAGFPKTESLNYKSELLKAVDDKYKNIVKTTIENRIQNLYGFK